MPDIDRYFIREIMKPFIGFAIALSAIVWLTQSLQMLELIVNRGQSLGTFLLVTAYIFPSLLAVILPFALFCAVIFSLNRMSSDSEIAVFWASGIGNMRMARPVVFIATVTMITTLIINLYLMPAGYRQMKDMIHEIRTDVATNLIREGEFTHPSPGVTLSTVKMKRTGEVQSLFLHDARDPTRLVTYDAELGRVVNTPSGPKLVLVNGTIQTEDANGQVTFLSFENHSLNLTEFVGASGPKLRELTERYLHELLNPDKSNPWVQQNLERLHAEGHNRLAAPLYNFTFVLVALCAFLTGPYSRRGRGFRISVAAGAGLLARIGGFGMQSIATEMPALQFLQYLLPIVVCLACVYLLSDAHGRVKRGVGILRDRFGQGAFAPPSPS